ncbi:hypothetical protein JOC85_001153 [Bacillus mesophilus]|uniref:Uncharacterized protein n=1 Tax=Bacillus mesophilus TaxID=1808955 RepID=A0A6M0Q3Y3_9BACI|nr:EH signature domain-containing protein [Bacillus mesophilus]MBM7660386.1 hypothetical protein [Bacillus mesophilus]NEY71095.1 hypothetical protein [Bacillus mesophilus]
MNSQYINRPFIFNSTHLDKESERMMQKYKDYDESTLEGYTSTRLPDLLDEIKSLLYKRDILDSYAENIKSIDLRLLAYAYPYEVNERETNKKIFYILKKRYNSFIGRKMWAHFHLLPKDALLHDLLEYAFTNEGNDFLSFQNKYRWEFDTVFKRQKDENVLHGISRYIVNCSSPTIKEAFVYRKIKEDSPLGRKLWALILFYGMGEKRFFEKEKISDIIARLNNLQNNDYNKVMNRYLEAFDVNQLHAEIMDLVERRIRDPRRNPQGWQSFSSKSVENAKRWFMIKELRQFFSKETKYDRFKYWNKYSHLLVDVKKIHSPPIAIMDFGDFVTVEFAEHGNAAYFYKKQPFFDFMYKRIKTLRIVENDLKDPHANYYINKLIHRATNYNPDAWHMRFNQYMTQYLKGNFGYKHTI